MSLDDKNVILSDNINRILDVNLRGPHDSKLEIEPEG